MTVGDTVTFNFDTFINVTPRRLVRIDNQIHGVIVKRYEVPLTPDDHEPLEFSVYVSKWDIHLDCWKNILLPV